MCIRDSIKTGQVRAVVGQTYMFNQDEELWAKELPPVVEDLLAQGRDPLADRSDRGKAGASKARDKTKVVVFRVPHNAAVQIYDYKDKKARYIICMFLFFYKKPGEGPSSKSFLILPKIGMFLVPKVY